MGRKAKSTPGGDAEGSSLSRKERRQLKEQAKVDELLPLLLGLRAEEASAQLAGVRELSALVDGLSSSCLDAWLQAGLVARVAELARQDACADLQGEALQLLAGLCEKCSHQMRDFLGVVTVDTLTVLLSSRNSRVREEAMTMLEYMAEASNECCDALRESAVLAAILQMQKSDGREQNVCVTRKAASFLKSLCVASASSLNEDAMLILLELLASLLMVKGDDEEVILKTCFALASLPYSNPHYLALLLQQGIFVSLVVHLTHASAKVQSEAARATHVIIVGSAPPGMMAFLLSEPIPALQEMLGSDDVLVKRWGTILTLRVLMAGGPHVREVVDAGCLPLLVGLLQIDDKETVQAAARALTIVSAKVPLEEFDILMTAEVALPMVKMLAAVDLHDPSCMARTAVFFLENILKRGRMLVEEKSDPRVDRFALLVKGADRKSVV